MKVDVYPNITNVEVYENPISVPVEATWEKMNFTVADPVINTFNLGLEVAVDRDGDFVIQVQYDSTISTYGDDFTISGTELTWVNQTNTLTSGKSLVVWFSPKSAYGSVPGSGEVTALSHLNDVQIEGPLAGQLLIRNGDSKFQNAYLTAGDNVSITSDGSGVSISANPNLAMSLLTQDTTALVQKAYLLDTSSNALTLTLPLAASLGDTIQAMCFGGENLTIARNGHKLNGLENDIVLTNGQVAMLRYANETIGWFRMI